MISQQQWVDLGKKIPIIAKPTAKIKKTKLIHLPPFDLIN
jgi:hypothetical protein